MATRHRRNTSARGASAARSVTAFSTSTRSRCSGNGAGASEIDSRRRADSGQRRAHHLAPPRRRPAARSPRRREQSISSMCARPSRSASVARRRRTRCGTASSNVRWRSPADVELVHLDELAVRAASRTDRCWSCRNRSRTRSRAAGLASSRHSVRCRQVSAEPATVSVTGPRASIHARGASTPNCQRTRFFPDERPVRVEQVALVQHRVGHRAGGRKAAVDVSSGPPEPSGSCRGMSSGRAAVIATRAACLRRSSSRSASASVREDAPTV